MRATDFAKKVKLTIGNPSYRFDSTMINYAVVLECQGRTMDVEFHTGFGWIEDAKTGEPAPGYRLDPASGKIMPAMRQHLTVYEVEQASKNYRIRRPSPEDILECLAVDAQTLIDADYDFDTYCENLGLNNDSIKEKKTFDNTVEEVADLKRVLGRELFEELLQVEEE